MNLKGIAYKETPINLDAGEQNDEEFRQINPLGSVPAMRIGGQDGKEPLTVSMNINRPSVIIQCVTTSLTSCLASY